MTELDDEAMACRLQSPTDRRTTSMGPSTEISRSTRSIQRCVTGAKSRIARSPPIRHSAPRPRRSGRCGSGYPMQPRSAPLMRKRDEGTRTHISPGIADGGLGTGARGVDAFGADRARDRARARQADSAVRRVIQAHQAVGSPTRKSRTPLRDIRRRRPCRLTRRPSRRTSGLARRWRRAPRAARIDRHRRATATRVLGWSRAATSGRRRRTVDT